MQSFIKSSIRNAEYETYLSNLYPIDCTLGSNPYGAPPKAIDFITHYQGEDISSYFSFNQIVGLTVAIQHYLGKTGVNAEQIFLGHGSFDILSFLFHKFIEPKGMLGIGPQFVTAVSEFKLTGGYYHSVPMKLTNGVEAFPVTDLIKEIEQNSSRYSFIFIDNPNNPTGYATSLKNLEQVIQVANKHDLLVIIDEAYGDFLPLEQSAINLVNRYDNLVSVRSLSKGWGLASIRVGYFTVPHSLCPMIRKVVAPFTPSFLSGRIATVALGDSEFLRTCRERTLADKKVACEIFQRAGFTILPTDPRVPIFTIYKAGVDVEKELEQLGIMVESGRYYTMTHTGINQQHARVRICSHSEDIVHLSYRLTRKYPPERNVSRY